METDYSSFLQSHRRDIACLSDGDRSVRKAGLDRIVTSCHGVAATPHLPCFFNEHLHLPLCKLLGDQTERIRENALDLILWILTNVSQLSIDSLPVCISAICDRITHSSEPSEEIRVKLVRVLAVLIPLLGHQVRQFSNDLITSLSKCIGDACPDVKKEGSDCIVVISRFLDASRFRQAANTKQLVSTLVYNLKHQHWRVRQACLNALQHLLGLQQDSGDAPLIKDFAEDVIPALTAVASDRSVPVRESLASALGSWMRAGCIPDDSTAVSFVENGSYCLVADRAGFSWDLRCLSLLASLVLDDDKAVSLRASAELSLLAQTARSAPLFVDQEELRVVIVHCNVSPVLSEFYADQAVFSFLGNAKRVNPVIKNALTLLGRSGTLHEGESVRLLAKRLLTVLCPYLVPHLSDCLTLLVLDAPSNLPEDRLLAQCIAKAGFLDFAVPVLRKSIHGYCSSQNWQLVSSALSVLRELLHASTISETCRVFALEALEEAVAKSPRNSFNAVIADCASVLAQDDRLYSLLLAAEARDLLLSAGAFNADFFAREAAKPRSARLPALSLLLSCSDYQVFQPFLETLVLPILREESRPDADGAIESRAAALEILHALFPRLHDTGEFVRLALRDICAPNCAWRPGNANSKLRKAALVCMYQAVSHNLLGPADCLELLVHCLPSFKSCLDDNWVPDNRLVSLALIKLLLQACILSPDNGELFRDIYPEMLKRLDDSQDPVRIEACACIGIIFARVGAEYKLLSRSSVSYILKSLLVHLDDQSEAVAAAVAEAVRCASRSCDLNLVREEMTAGEARSSRPRRFADLLASL